MMQFDWQDLFEQTKQRGGFSSDAEVAAYLGVTRAQISAWRNGKSDLGTFTKLKLLHALGYDSLNPIIRSLWPPDSAEERLQQHFRLVERVRGGEPVRRAANLLSTDGVPLTGNHLLAEMPDGELKRLQPYLKDVSLVVGAAVHEQGARTLKAYFPTTAVVTVVHVLANGAPAETAIVGRDGFVGISLVAGAGTVASKTIVQGSGHAFCLDAALIENCFRLDGPFRRILLRSAQALFAQMADASVCNVRHSLAQRLCRWILLTVQQVDGKFVELPVDVLSEILGDSPSKIMAEARKLSAVGAISYTGKSSKFIEVLDKSALMSRVCACHVARNGRTSIDRSFL